jgi:hypothetical protein
MIHSIIKQINGNQKFKIAEQLTTAFKSINNFSE